MNDLRIVFMGTPDFAVSSLEVLVNHGFYIAAVVTAPDRPQGRGLKLAASPVKQYALQRGIPVLQPANLKSPDFAETLRNIGTNLQVVVAFRMLPDVIWRLPAKGTFNLHASLLPHYRGAAPINWAIINGEKETGVTTFFLEHEIDTGAIIFQEKEPIAPNDTAGALYHRLAQRGATLVLKTVQAIQAGSPPVTRQPPANGLKHAPKIFRETCEINWNQPAGRVYDFVRGLSPYPAAWTRINGQVFKIFRTAPATGRAPAAPGTVATDQKTSLLVCAQDGWLAVQELQAEGKKKMEIQEFFRGNKIEAPYQAITP
jgi:methionyl-tRNA formyltransferase